MPRLFVAIPLPDDVRDRLAMLTGGVPGARWVAAENYHITLRFLGDVAAGDIDDIVGALSRVSVDAFTVDLAGIGFFGSPRKPRTLWVGAAPTTDEAARLRHLHDKVDRALVGTGMAPDERKFTPHVTLAYLKNPNRDRVGRWLQEHGLLRAGPVPVDGFALYESRTGGDGSVYIELARFDLDSITA